MHPLILPCPVIITDNRPDSLHNPICRQENERLQLVINTENQHTRIRHCRQNAVQCRNQQRRQRLIENRRNSDTVNSAGKTALPPALRQTYPDRPEPTTQIQRQINSERHRLPDHRRCRAALNPHRRNRPEPENHDRIEHNIRDTARDHRRHRRLHPPDRLKQLLQNQMYLTHDTQPQHNPPVSDTVGNHLRVCRKRPQKRRRDPHQHHRHHRRMDKTQQQTDRCRAVCPLPVPRAKIKRHRRIHTDTEPDTHRTGNILQRKHQRDRRHRLLADPRNKETIHNIVERIHQHRQSHRQRHRQHKRKHRPRLHKRLIHRTPPELSLTSLACLGQFLSQTS